MQTITAIYEIMSIFGVFVSGIQMTRLHRPQLSIHAPVLTSDKCLLT